MASCSLASPDAASLEASAETTALSPMLCSAPSNLVESGGDAACGSECSSDDELARTLDAAPWDDDDDGGVCGAPPSKCCRLIPTAAEAAVFGSVDLLARIAAFSPSLHLSQLAALGRSWDGATQLEWRRRACGVLAEAMPLPVAVQVEACVYAHCSARAGPGAYNAKVRQLALNLKGNASLAARVRAGAVAPDLLVRLPSDEMRTAAAERRDERWRRAAAEAAVRRPPPAHVVNVYRCSACGSTRQWLRRRVRLTDITMATEFLVCVECFEVVPPVPLRAERAREAEAAGGRRAASEAVAGGGAAAEVVRSGAAALGL